MATEDITSISASEIQEEDGDWKIEKITTTEILEELTKARGDNTEFFYLYVATGGKDHELPDGDEQMDTHVMPLNITTTESTPQPVRPRDPRNDAMEKARRIQRKVLSRHGWKKVYDKDETVTYRALYFNNTIKKSANDDEITYILHVAEVRDELANEVAKIREKYGVNFKINSLLSKPLLYDKSAIEQLRRQHGELSLVKSSQTGIV